MRFARRSGVILAWVVMLVLGGVARGEDPKAVARPLVQHADIEYKLGRFAEALAEYTKAYEVYPTPPLLFNIAQCHRNLRNYERAKFFFEGYLRDSPRTESRALVEDLIREATAELDKQAAARREAADDQLHADEDAARRRAEEDRRVAEARRGSAPPGASNKPVYKKWWFWSAVGGAAIVTGGTLYYFSGDTTVVEPSGSLGGLDRR
jgi:tetratricopeptide (TPR) repeat protein